MPRDLRFQSMPLAEDFDVGDDSDMPGFGQPIAQDDIDALLNSPTASEEERRSLLQSVRDDLKGRQGLDESGEYQSLIDQLEQALATLSLTADGVGTPEAFALDSDERDAPPDELLERAEDELNEDQD